MKLQAVTAAAGPLLVVHGGAGPLRADLSRPESLTGRQDGLRQALAAGWRVLAAGGSALDAVQAAVEALEDHPLYNAGRGSVLSSQGVVEMDAALMDGRDLRAGALCGARRLRNPIRAARRLLEEGRVFSEARAVEDWLAARGLVLQDPDWFRTEERAAQLAAAQAGGHVLLDHAGAAAPARDDDAGTVGAAARDAAGDLAAATSTGGMTNKPAGRIGDSPVIGAGTYADNRSLAVSATGVGEAFIRTVFAHELEARVRLGGQSLEEAVSAALERVAEVGGEGGCVSVGRDGAALAFNSQGMYRAWVDPAAGRWGLAIFGEDELQGGPLADLLV
ncbi:MAG: isoaspartyl peptidase/L-asparaginase [Candidatus Delongbacteria bacterium]